MEEARLRLADDFPTSLDAPSAASYFVDGAGVEAPQPMATGGFNQGCSNGGATGGCERVRPLF